MNKIDFKKVKTDNNLFREFERFMKERFNTQITKRQYVEFIQTCASGDGYYLNPFYMCAWLLKKPVQVIEDRWYQKKENVHVSI